MSTLQARGGFRIRNALFENVTGTLGCVVRSRETPTVRYVLSAAHVLNPGGYASQGNAVEAQIGGSWRKIAELDDWTLLRHTADSLQRCDAAIARITAPELVSEEIDGIGVPQGVAQWAFEDKRLQMRGAETAAVVEARVHSTGNQAPVHYEDPFGGGIFSLTFEQQILYGKVHGSWSEATQAGDSGALVLDNNGLAVGLHIARTDDAYPLRASVCTPLQLVLDEFGVDLAGSAASTAPTTTSRATAASASTPAPLVIDADKLGERSWQRFGLSVMAQLVPHSVYDGVRWQLSAEGLIVGGRLDRSLGQLATVPRVWRDFGADIQAAATEFKVPVELIIATICTESSGNVNVPSRPESGGRLSVGLMQTLIGTARETLPAEDLDEAKLKVPRISIRAGTAYIHRQQRITLLDPPVVACAYNAGGVYPNGGPGNRWKLRQYPLDSSAHADRFVQWFNDCFAFFSQFPVEAPASAAAPSFWRLFRE